MLTSMPTTMSSASQKLGTLQPTCTANVWIANAPLTEFTATQPAPEVTALSVAGRRLPVNPNAPRLWISCATPKRGPKVDSIPWVPEPRAVPTRSPSTVGQKPPPKVTIGNTPTYTVANSGLGDGHV